MKRNLATLIAIAGLVVMTTPSNTFAGNTGGKPGKTKSQGGSSKPSTPSGKDEINLAHVRGSDPGKGGNNPNQNPNQNNDDCNGKCGGNFSYEDYLAMKNKIREYKSKEKMDRKDCVATRKAINGDFRAQYKFYQALQRQKGVGKVTQGTATAKLPGALFFKIPFEDKKGVVTTKTYPSTPACYRLIMNQYYGGCQTFGEKLAPGVENQRFENKWSEVEFAKDVIASFDKDGNVNTCEAVDQKVVNSTPAPTTSDGSIPNTSFENPGTHEAVSTVAVGNQPTPIQSVAATTAATATTAGTLEGNIAPSGTPTGTPSGTPSGTPTGTPTDTPTGTPTGQPTSAPIATGPDATTTNATTVANLDDLKKQLADKDAKINELETKIKALEKMLSDKDAENIALNREIGELRKQLADCQEEKQNLVAKVEAPTTSPTNTEVEVDLNDLDNTTPAQARRKITINLTGVDIPTAKEIAEIAKKLSEEVKDADVIINITIGGSSEQVANNTTKPTQTNVPSQPTSSTTTQPTTQPSTTTTSGSLVDAEDVWNSTPPANDDTPAPVEQPIVAKPVEKPVEQPGVTKPAPTKPVAKPVVAKPKKPACEISGTCFSQTFNLAVTSLCKDLKNYKGGSCQFVASVSNNKSSLWYKQLAKSVKSHGNKMTVDQLRDEGFLDSRPGKWWTVKEVVKNGTGYQFGLDHKTVSKNGKMVIMNVKT